MKKLCKAILVETKDKTSSIGRYTDNGYLTRNKFREQDSLTIPQHLYIISLDPDEKIEEDDYWIYICPTSGIDYGDEGVAVVKSNLPSTWFDKLHDKKNYFKIIASTDELEGKEYIPTYSNGNHKGERVIPILPSLSSEYIQQYIKEYNAGDMKDILVEWDGKFDIDRCCANCYHYQWSTSFSEYLCKNGRIFLSECDRGVLNWFPKDDSIFKPRLTNNCITIHPVDPVVYTEEEVKELCHIAWYETYKLNHSNFEEWFETNKKK